MTKKSRWVGMILGCLGCLSGPCSGVEQESTTLQALLDAESLTPTGFFKHFEEFKYRYRREIQSPDVFLTTQSGDCDDFATLADKVLSSHGYTTRLISVRMPGINHVVCYIEEEKAYLDFNNRIFLKKLVRCDRRIERIAGKVARSFNRNWTSAVEFDYLDGMKKPRIKVDSESE